MIADILGVQKGTLKNVVQLNERLKGKNARVKRPIPSGVPREVLQLCGNSLTSLPIRTHATGSIDIGNGDLSRQSGSKWVWCSFDNSAHSGNIHLHHWQQFDDVETRNLDIKRKETDSSPDLLSVPGLLCNKSTLGSSESSLRVETSLDIKDNIIDSTVAQINSECNHPKETSSLQSQNVLDSHQLEAVQSCCQFRSKYDYPPAAFNKKSQVVRYSSALYQKLLTNLDLSWTPWETDYLFDLCTEFELRFLIIFDRYAPLDVLNDTLRKINSDTCIQSKTESTTEHSQQQTSESPSQIPSISALSSMTKESLMAIIEKVQLSHPRSLEQLKDRYYSISRRIIEHEFSKKIQSVERRFASLAASVSPDNVEMLTQQKTQLLSETRSEMARHPLVKFMYDASADKQRRIFLERQFQKSEKERREERLLIQQLAKSETQAKRIAKKDEACITKKKKKSVIGSGGSIGESQNESFEPIPLTNYQNQLLHQRKSGPILASQVMQQFAAPILQSTIVPTVGNTSITVSSGLTGTGTTSTSAGSTLGRHSTSQHNTATNNPLTTIKKHEERLELELKNLGFGSSGAPLWPTYNDREIVEAFNALRIDIVTMINWNIKLEQLEKEKTVWKAKVAQLKDEGSSTSSPCSMDSGKKLGDNLAHSDPSQIGNNYVSKKKHVRQVGIDRATKKPRKTSKRPPPQAK